MAPFEIVARDAASRARAGVLTTAHGDVRTPAFVPLATKATVRGLTPAEVILANRMEPQGPFSPPQAPTGRPSGARILWAEIATYAIVAGVAVALLLYFLLR